MDEDISDDTGGDQMDDNPSDLVGGDHMNLPDEPYVVQVIWISYYFNKSFINNAKNMREGIQGGGRIFYGNL